MTGADGIFIFGLVIGFCIGGSCATIIVLAIAGACPTRKRWEDNERTID